MAQIVTNLSIPASKAIRIDESGGGVTYIGMAKVGADEAGAVWQIRKVTKSGGVTSFEYADGNNNFDNKWSERTGLTYS